MKEKNKVNYYKISTLVLVLIIALIAGIYLINTYSKNQYNQGVKYGQQNTINLLVKEVSSKGQVTFTKNNENLTLVPAQDVKIGQQQLIKYILSNVRQKGYISLYDNVSQIVLVPQRVINQTSNQTASNSTI